MPPRPHEGAPSHRRVLVLVLALVALTALAASDRAHTLALDAVRIGEGLIGRHPSAGIVAFVVLSAASAMLAFFSTVPLVPVAVAAWGEWPTAVLLWGAWWLGGLATYGLGRILGERVARLAVPSETLERYTRVLRDRAGFGTILVFQLALPSEVPGYVLGTLRYRMGVYLVALALAELPYALAGVFLSEGFLQRRFWLLLLVGVALVTLSALSLSRLRRTLRRAAGE
ncbi:MAG: VTT domain-containing protein [Gemmatimonadota bacterium]